MPKVAIYSKALDPNVGIICIPGALGVGLGELAPKSHGAEFRVGGLGTLDPAPCTLNLG